MDIVADADIPFPRPLVFATYRDKMTEMLSYFPNVRAIDVKSRSDEGAITKLVNIWHGGGEIPAAMRAFLSEAMLSWTDHATWNEDDFTCEWRIETHAFTEAVTCGGRNRFVETPAGTKLEIRGSLTIDAKKIKGVPSLLAGKVGKGVEEFLANKIKPNLIETSVGVRKFLEAQKS
jgi:hypothetical protein